MAGRQVGLVCDAVRQACDRAGARVEFACLDNDALDWAHAVVDDGQGPLASLTITRERAGGGDDVLVAGAALRHPRAAPLGARQHDHPFFPTAQRRPAGPCVRVRVGARGWFEAVASQLADELRAQRDHSRPPPREWESHPLQSSQLYNPEVPQLDAIDPTQLQSMLDNLTATLSGAVVPHNQ